MKYDIQETLMRRYLVGDLPESEATRLEEEFLTDDERFEQMGQIENELVDGYVRGRLSSEDRERFERYYLASPVHRRRVALARNLIEEADKSSAKAIPFEPKVSWRTRVSEKLGVSFASWQLALTAAAMLLLAAGSLWLFLDRTRLRHELAGLKAESEARQSREQEMADQIAAAHGRSENPATELERLRAERNVITQQPTATPPQAPRPNVFSFLLSPVLMRGGGDPQTLTIPLKTGVVRLQMKAEGEDAPRYRVSVRTVEGRHTWSRQTIKPRIDNAKGAVVTADIPAGKLVRGDYILTLSSVDSTGEPEEVNRYFFRVIRR